MHSGILSMSRDSLIEKTRSFDFAQDDKSVINQFDKILNNQYTKNLNTNHSNHNNDLISPEQNHEHIYH